MVKGFGVFKLKSTVTLSGNKIIKSEESHINPQYFMIYRFACKIGVIKGGRPT